jgi:hypothetical protein
LFRIRCSRTGIRIRITQKELTTQVNQTNQGRWHSEYVTGLLREFIKGFFLFRIQQEIGLESEQSTHFSLDSLFFRFWIKHWETPVVGCQALGSHGR